MWQGTAREKAPQSAATRQKTAENFIGNHPGENEAADHELLELVPDNQPDSLADFGDHEDPEKDTSDASLPTAEAAAAEHRPGNGPEFVEVSKS